MLSISKLFPELYFLTVILVHNILCYLFLLPWMFVFVDINIVVFSVLLSFIL